VLAGAIRATFPEVSSLLIVAIGGSVPSASKLAVFKAERSRLWSSLEENAVKLPEGERAVVRLEYDDGLLGYAGAIHTTYDQFEICVELTRTLTSLCVGGMLGPKLYSYISSSHRKSPPSKTELLRESISRLDIDSFIVRGFGAFDDGIVGAEVFLSGQRADALQRQLSLLAVSNELKLVTSPDLSCAQQSGRWDRDVSPRLIFCS
jgi:hypothetical protein